MHPLRSMYEPLPGLHRGRRARLWLGLFRPDGRGIDAEPARPRRGGASTERLDLLRTVRERVSGQDSVAEDDAALAGAAICREAEPTGLPLWTLLVGLGSPPAGPLSCAGRACQPCPRAVPHPSAGQWLDRGARFAGAGGPQLPQLVG